MWESLKTRWKWNNWRAYWWGITHHDIRDAEIRIFCILSGSPRIVGIYLPPIVCVSKDLEDDYCLELVKSNPEYFFGEDDNDWGEDDNDWSECDDEESEFYKDSGYY